MIDPTHATLSSFNHCDMMLSTAIKRQIYTTSWLASSRLILFPWSWQSVTPQVYLLPYNAVSATSTIVSRKRAHGPSEASGKLVQGRQKCYFW